MKGFILALSFLTTAAHAGICEIYVERTACSPATEKDSYVKCGGNKSCSSKKKAETEAECKKLGEEECSNSRLDITKSKIVKVTFGGKQGENLCKADRADFNKCK